MPKYRDYFRQMLDENEEVFEEFAQVHAQYSLDKSRWQEEFNQKGERAITLIREWESKLCGHSEKGEYAKYSGNLAEKFWGEVKAFFPLIDFVGVEIKREPQFVIKGQTEETVEEENPVEEMDEDILEIEKFEVLDKDEFVVTRIR